MRRRNPGRTFVGTCILLACWTLAAGPDGASGNYLHHFYYRNFANVIKTVTRCIDNVIGRALSITRVTRRNAL